MRAVTRSALAACSMTAVAGCSTGDGGIEFMRSVDPTGCVLEQVTSEPYDEYQVQGVSRDGRYLSHTLNRGDDAQGNLRRTVFIVDLQTGARKTLDAKINNSGAFSPDGRYLVVADDDEHGKTEIIELDIEAGTTTTIASRPEAWDWLPSYSPDGKQIVFNSNRIDGQMDVFIYERASGALQRLTTFDGYDAHAQFSPDGKRILFHRMQSEREDGGYDFDLFTIDLSTGAETRLTNGPLEESYGAFAPDGLHIVMSSDFEENPEQHNLYVRAPDGSLTALTDGDWVDRYAYWTADGRYIYFNSDRGAVTNVYRIPMEGMDCIRE